MLYTSLQILLSFVGVSFNVGALYLSRMPTQSEKEDGKWPEISKEVDGNFLLRNIKLLYRGIVNPARKDAHFENNIPTKQIRVATVSKLDGRFEFTDAAQYDTLGSKQASSPEVQRAGRPKSAPIGRRDKLLFWGFFLVVFSVNLTTILILVL